MPDLPAKTLSQAHFDRIVATFPGANNTEKAAAYDDWLTNRLIERVRYAEMRNYQQQAALVVKQGEDAIIAGLPALRPEPQVP